MVINSNSIHLAFRLTFGNQHTILTNLANCFLETKIDSLELPFRNEWDSQDNTITSEKNTPQKRPSNYKNKNMNGTTLVEICVPCTISTKQNCL